MRFWNKKPKEKSWIELRYEEIKSFRDIGEKFNYLGAEIIVTHHKTLETLATGFGFEFYDKPCIVGNYVSDSGEIKKVTFSYEELPALRAENETTNH